MAGCLAQLRSNDIAAGQATMTMPTGEADAAGSSDPCALRNLAAWYREFSDRASELWIREGRLMTAQALEQEAARLEARSNHRQASQQPAGILRSTEGNGTTTPEIAALLATKLRCIVPMIAIYVTAYLGLSILSGFARPLLGTKVLGPINLCFALIALNYMVAWVLAVIYARIANRWFDPLVRRIVEAMAHGGVS
jgi:uncharacterized membrane protein (DUF485 family)